jgi:hypothetical protein
MDNSFPSAQQGGGTLMRDLTWSHGEKVIAREAFRRALEREFRRSSQKRRRWPRTLSNQLTSGNWRATSPIAARTSTADTTTNTRFYRMEELRGLREDKLEAIRSFVRLFDDVDAA